MDEKQTSRDETDLHDATLSIPSLGGSGDVVLAKEGRNDSHVLVWHCDRSRKEDQNRTTKSKKERQTRENANDLHLGDRDKLAETLENLLNLTFGGNVTIHSILLFYTIIVIIKSSSHQVIKSSSHQVRQGQGRRGRRERRIGRTLISSRAFSMRTTG